MNRYSNCNKIGVLAVSVIICINPNRQVDYVFFSSVGGQHRKNKACAPGSSIPHERVSASPPEYTYMRSDCLSQVLLEWRIGEAIDTLNKCAFCAFFSAVCAMIMKFVLDLRHGFWGCGLWAVCADEITSK